MEGYQLGRGRERMGGKGAGVNKHTYLVQNRLRDAKNSIRNGEAKELISMTHGHELRGGIAGGKGGTGQRGTKGEK